MGTKQQSNFDGMSIPDSKDLERQVLADLIGNPDIIPSAGAIIDRSAFSVEEYGRVWDTINDMINQGATVDLASVGARIDRNTRDRVLKCQAAGEVGTMDHCRGLSQMANRRLLFFRAHEIMSKASNNGSDYSELLSMPGNLVAELANTARAGAGTESVCDALNDFASTVEADQVKRTNGKPSRVPTGFPMLDKLTYSGFAPGNLIVLAARPSVGKTAIMLQMALAASRAGFPATVYSLEMTNQELAQRLVISTGEVTPGQLANRTVDWQSMERAISRFDDSPLRLNDECQTLDDVCHTIMLDRQRGQCSIAFVDHLHRIRPTDPRQPIYQAIAERTGRIKSLAKQCGIPVVLLAQLNRLSENENRPPELRDLRDSGSIEQDADIVLMLERADGTGAGSNVNMWVRKNRQGEAGNICIRLRGANSFTVFNESQRTTPTMENVTAGDRDLDNDDL